MYLFMISTEFFTTTERTKSKKNWILNFHAARSWRSTQSKFCTLRTSNKVSINSSHLRRPVIALTRPILSHRGSPIFIGHPRWDTLNCYCFIITSLFWKCPTYQRVIQSLTNLFGKETIISKSSWPNLPKK